MSEPEDRNRAKLKFSTTPLNVPSPVRVKTSPCSSPYFQKLPPLSPRSMKLIDPSYVASADYTRKQSADYCIRSSGESTTSSNDSGYLENGGDFVVKIEETQDTNNDDINFFLQVVGVFREYVNNQISDLDGQCKDISRQQEFMQSKLKKAENNAQKLENQLMSDFSHLISLIHLKQAELKDKLKKQNKEQMEQLRENSELCRRNLKLVSGILNFAKRLKNESGESLRENAVKELKQRLCIISELQQPDLVEISDELPPSLIDLKGMKRVLQSMNICSKIDYLDPTTNEAFSAADSAQIPVICAPRSTYDVTKNSVTVRWFCQENEGDLFDLEWSCKIRGEAKTNSQNGIATKGYVLRDLPSNCDVIVRVRHQTNNGAWSLPAQFKTLPSPATFHFDTNTAHVKLKVSQDLNSVYFPSNEKPNESPKSPSRFTFALNVLGSISFYSGRNYWEVLCNRDGWAVGVALQSVPRNSWLGSNDASWILHYNAAKFEYKVRHSGEPVEVEPELETPRHYLKRVGIYLDYDYGMIRFVDPIHKQILHTYHEGHFTEPVCAAVNPFYHGGKLTLLTGLDIPSFLTQN